VGNPNKAAEDEFRQIIGVEDNSSQSSDSSVEFSPNQLTVKPDKQRTKRLRERQKRRKELKSKRKQKKIVVIAGIPTNTQSCNDIIVDETLQLAANEHALSTIPDINDTIVDPEPHDAIAPETEQVDHPNVPIMNTNNDTHTTSVQEKGEAAVLDKGEKNSDKSVSFDIEPPPPRKDPLAPSPMLQEAPLLLRRSSRNVNKPSRFRAMFTKTAALVILPIVPTHCTFIGTHDHMVLEHALPHHDWTYMLPETPFQVS
jgi:hypothetical protein